jgi:hypothetical protein
VPLPDEVRLLARSYRTPDPGEVIDMPPRLEQRPIARWLPRTDDSSSEYLPIEAFNPVIEKFEQLRKDVDNP